MWFKTDNFSLLEYICTSKPKNSLQKLHLFLQQPIFECKTMTSALKLARIQFKNCFIPKCTYVFKESLLHKIDSNCYIYATLRKQFIAEIATLLQIDQNWMGQTLTCSLQNYKLTINYQQNCISFFKATAKICLPHFKAASATTLLRKLSD